MNGRHYTQEEWEYVFTHEWLRWEEHTGSQTMPETIEQTLRIWRLRYGVPLQAIIDALELAFNSTAANHDGVGLYFCKVIWNKIGEAASRGWGA